MRAASMVDLHTLIVEDSAETLLLLEAFCRSRGHRVTACADAESAWKAYQQMLYPLVILDLLLPGMDGFQLCRRMRTSTFGEQSVIVVLTGRAQPEDLQRVLDAGADDYLTKPVHIPLLSVRIAIAERQAHMRAERRHASMRLAETLLQLQQSRDDMLSILNQLQLGTAMTDEAGRITFLSQASQRFLGLGAEAAVGQLWERVCPFQPQETAQLQTMVRVPPAQRQRVSVHVEGAQHRRYWLEIDVQDDPRNAQRKIFFLYDISDLQNLRRLLDEKVQFYDLVGKSLAMQQVYQQIREVAQVDTTVLIEGDTGTGKELVARAIHAASHRHDKPFIAVNCAGFTESLLSSQLFGHKRGAFTGAIADHQGFFDAAHGGTLFLDEIGEMPVQVQTSLLRVLQEREIVRLGESRPRKIDVRIVVATHRNLLAAVTQGSFRADLFYRIRVAKIVLPPLRERPEDIPLLVSVFLDRYRATLGKAIQDVSPGVLRALMTYAWPGNVRELQSTIECAAIRCQGTTIQCDDLPTDFLTSMTSGGGAQPLSAPDVLGNEAERVRMALQRARGNRTMAARLLGIGRSTLYRRLANLNVT